MKEHSNDRDKAEQSAHQRKNRGKGRAKRVWGGRTPPLWVVGGGPVFFFFFLSSPYKNPLKGAAGGGCFRM